MLQFNKKIVNDHLTYHATIGLKSSNLFQILLPILKVYLHKKHVTTFYLNNKVLLPFLLFLHIVFLIFRREIKIIRN